MLFFVGYGNQAYSWNDVGHRLIAQIAYDHLTTHAKKRFNHYNQACVTNKRINFVASSVWLDHIRAQTHVYDAMHYIDIPFSIDGHALPAISRNNAASSIEKAILILSRSNTSLAGKCRALHILVHVVGDIHQPLHTATRISWVYPEGDRGGNLVRLRHNKVANNLHAYWDRGAGLLVGKRRYGRAWIKKRAIALAQQWPCHNANLDPVPMHWARESHALAIDTAYQLPYANRDNFYYQKKAQTVIEPRLVLAGCRLASVLNHIDKAGNHERVKLAQHPLISFEK